MDDRSPHPESRPPDDPVMKFLDEWFWPFVEEGTLWPVLFAVLAHISVLLAILFIQAWRIRAAWAWAGIVFLGLIAFDLVRREFAIRKRPGRVAVIVAVVWVVGAVTAVLTGWWGIF